MNFSRLTIMPVVSVVLLVSTIFMYGLEFAWYEIFPVIGFIFLLTNWLIPFLWMKRVPLAARILTEASQKKQVPAYIVHDSGRGAFVLLEERRGEGLVFAHAHGQRRRYRLLPRIVDVEEEDLKKSEKTSAGAEGKGNPKEKKKKKMKLLLDYASDWINKRSICVGLGLPIYFGYSGTLCLLNPECMALYEAGKIFIPSEEKPQPETDVEKQLPWPLMLLSSLDMKKIINKRFDTTQTDALEIDAKLLGQLGAGLPNWMLWVAVAVIAIIAIVVLVFFPPFG